MKSVLHFSEVSFAYGPQPVIDRLSVSVEPGDFFAIIGPNGSGKTTLLRLVLGSLAPRAGQIRLFGRPLAGFRRREIARRMALVPQSAAVAFPFSVRQIVEMGRTPHLGWLGLEGAAGSQKVEQAIATVGLADLGQRPLDRLSGGEAQRAWIARALCQEPDLLLLDEPTAALDLGHQLQIMRLLARLQHDRGLTVVMVSHDLNLAAMFASRMLLIHQGRAVCTGTPRQVLRPEHIHAVYGCNVLVDRHPQGDFPRITLPLDGAET